MGVVEEIDVLCTEMVRALLPVNTYIGFDGNVFGQKAEEDDAYEEMHWAHALRALYTPMGDAVEVKISHWHAHTACITGLYFCDAAIVDARSLREGRCFKVPARIDRVAGDSILFEALGRRVANVSFALENDHNELYDEGFVSIEGVEIQFFDDENADLVSMRDALLMQKYRVEKQLTASAFTGSYANFISAFGVGSSAMYGQLLPNNNFDDLFE